ncbi:MAG: hypothetical protein PHV81_00200 [Candidatus Methanomethylophilaceae archaeon]|jgi:sulfur carrier protein|nr:hypothetical protein [Candidatus Methanomethylophilaceae archaeon]NCA73465.1 hypothetical protein [Gammaproteobacteria bacterium]MDD3351180.1 hypothetical protein [Candidatus Methanomethylophilaceae archaeon]MDD3986228.1 hypothetical protein [Candidatus Methanomethylophilaceae archaeon]MDD4709066.1 hypothetical protein [Candidatus Methanomethylophilaceae archaeon]
MGAVISMYGKDTEVAAGGTVGGALGSMGLLPNAFLFLIGGTPVPSDTPLEDGMVVRAIKVASGG